jgi:YggT family protein
MLLLGTARDTIGNYVWAVFEVYIVLILLYILANLLFSFGVRPSYSRTFDAVLGFLRDVSEPYLRLFRKFIPSIGMFDLSPMIAIIVLYIVGTLISGVIKG